ncbi:MAG: hypothetical protein SPL82_14585 [Lachnospiraceae bacterium]|nr:hypothetical protein [Lachnospiraceae bacterium]
MDLHYVTHKHRTLRYAVKRALGWGQELFNGRTSHNHETDTENLHKYRKEKVKAGRRSIRRQKYPIEPHDIVIYKGKKYETSGCHNNGTRTILLPGKKSVAVKKPSGCKACRRIL